MATSSTIDEKSLRAWNLESLDVERAKTLALGFPFEHEQATSAIETVNKKDR